MVDELRISEKSKDEELFDLTECILEGTEARIPLKFEYPGTDKTVGVFIRPVQTTEFNMASRDPNNLALNVLEIALYDRNGELFTRDVLEKLPAGLVTELYKRIADVSGIPTSNKEMEKEIIDKYMGF